MKVLITDDLKGHYDWVSQVIDLMKKNDVSQTTIPFSSSGMKRNCRDSFNNELMQRLKGCGTGKKLRTSKSMVKFESYLDILKNQKQRKIKFTRLRIERGRYGAKSTQVNQRTYKL